MAAKILSRQRESFHLDLTEEIESIELEERCKSQLVDVMEDAEESKDGLGIVGNTAVVGQAQKMLANDLAHFESNIDGLMISGRATQLHEDEQPDGEARPDLNLDIVGRR